MACVGGQHRALELGAEHAVNPRTLKADSMRVSSERVHSAAAPPCWSVRSPGAQAMPASTSRSWAGSMRIRRSPSTPMFGVKAIPLSTQNTLHDGETPMPAR